MLLLLVLFCYKCCLPLPKWKSKQKVQKGISTATDPITRSTFFNHGIRHVTFYFPVSNLLLGKKRYVFRTDREKSIRRVGVFVFIRFPPLIIVSFWKACVTEIESVVTFSSRSCRCKFGASCYYIFFFSAAQQPM